MTSTRGWATTTNGRISMEVGDAEEIRRSLNALDGTKRYAVSLWKLPPDVAFERVDLKEWPEDYLQTAGSRDRMTVELRRTDTPAGVPSHVVLANPNSAAQPSDPMETIDWDEFDVVVMAHEVFDAQSAYDAFISYLDDPALSTYGQRPL